MLKLHWNILLGKTAPCIKQLYHGKGAGRKRCSVPQGYRG